MQTVAAAVFKGLYHLAGDMQWFGCGYPFQTLNGTVVKEISTSNWIKFSALCNILLKSALGSQLCMKGRKSCSFLLHKYIIPSLHCIWDSIFRKAQCFRNEHPRQKLQKGEPICEQPLSAAIFVYAFMVQQNTVPLSYLIIMLTSYYPTINDFM